MKLTIKNEWAGLKEKLLKLEYQLPEKGENWARACGQFLNNRYRAHLDSQGRGGAPPPLSPITLRLYKRMGNPDGTGIRNHIELESDRQGNKYTVIFGITAGRGTMVAKVQDQGATIKVTQRMRGFLARNGVFLRGSTTHIHVPGRHSWSESNQDARSYARTQLKKLWKDIRS
jgi:hypothetical protein